jgi:hypothetical protein
MKSMISKTLAMFAILATLSAFSSKPGGEGFEIFLNNQVILQQFGKEMNAAKNLDLGTATANDKLVIKYYHCGQRGTKRSITIKDGQNNILKKFRFTDSPVTGMAMSIPLQEILSLQKGKIYNLNLFYSSSELPGGRMLASVVGKTSVNSKP